MCGARRYIVPYGQYCRYTEIAPEREKQGGVVLPVVHKLRLKTGERIFRLFLRGGHDQTDVPVAPGHGVDFPHRGGAGGMYMALTALHDMGVFALLC